MSGFTAGIQWLKAPSYDFSHGRENRVMDLWLGLQILRFLSLVLTPC